MPHRSISVAVLVVLASTLAGCSKKNGEAAPTGSPTSSAITEAEFVAEYQAACEATATASADLEIPTEDGGTFPPSPPKDALRDWAIYFSQLSLIEHEMLADLEAISVSDDEQGDVDALLVLRRKAQVDIEALVEAADGGDPEAFSAAYADRVADSAEASRAEEALGIDCRV